MGSQGTAHDITERMKVRTALQESEAKYRNLVETAHDRIWRVDADGRYVYLNPAWKGVLGYEPAEMLGRPFSDFRKPEEAAEAMERFRSAFAEGRETKGAWAYVTKSGEKRMIRIHGAPLRDGEGRVVGAQGMAYDITDARRAREAWRGVSSQVRVSGDTAPDVRAGLDD